MEYDYEHAISVAYNLVMIAIYLIPPILYYRQRRHYLPPLKKSMIYVTCVIYTVAIHFIIVFLLYLSSDIAVTTSTPSFFWGFVAGFICSSLCRDDKPAKPKPEPPKELEPLPIENKPQPQEAEQMSLDSIIEMPKAATEETTKKSHAKAILASLLVISIAGNIFLGVSMANTNSTISSLKTELAEEERLHKQALAEASEAMKEVSRLDFAYPLLDKYNELLDRTNSMAYDYHFYDSSACVVSSDNDTKYHRHSCSYFDTFSGYYIFNVEYAQYLGYEPCPACEPPA